MKANQTVVVFRKWKSPHQGIIALFPEEPASLTGSDCSSYEHQGQHGAADYALVVSRTVPASPKESADLKRELEGIGYNLVERKRETPQMRDRRKRKAKDAF